MVGKVSDSMTKKNEKNKPVLGKIPIRRIRSVSMPEQYLNNLHDVTTSEEGRKISERGAMTKPILGSARAKKIMEECIKKQRFLMDEARKKMHFLIFVIVMTLLVHFIVSPFILRECIEERPDVILEIPLEESPYLPASLNYTLYDAYMIKSKNFTGVFFSHNKLKPDYRMHIFNKSVEFSPLAPLVQTEYNDYAMVKYVIAANLPIIVSYGFGLLIYLVYEIATGAKKRNVAAVKFKIVVVTPFVVESH